MTAEELQTYFSALLKSHSWSTVSFDRCGLQFFYRYVLKRPWDWTEIVKPPRPQRLPDVLTREETLRLLGTVRKLRYRVFFTTLLQHGPASERGAGAGGGRHRRAAAADPCARGQRRLLRNADGQVTFRYTDNTGTHKTRTLAGADFLWLLLAMSSQGLSAQSRLRLCPCQLQAAHPAAASGAALHPAPAQATTAAVLQTVRRNGDSVDLPHPRPSEIRGKARGGGPGDGDVTRATPSPPASGHSRPRGALGSKSGVFDAI